MLPPLGLLAFVFGNKVVHSLTKRQLKETWHTLLTLHETMEIQIHNDIIGLYAGRTKQRFDDSAQANKAMQTPQLLEQRFLDKHNEPVPKLLHNIRHAPSVSFKIRASFLCHLMSKQTHCH